VAPTGIPHCSDADDVYNGFTVCIFAIPAQGKFVLMKLVDSQRNYDHSLHLEYGPLRVLSLVRFKTEHPQHHNEAEFPNSYTFDPERFLKSPNDSPDSLTEGHHGFGALFNSP
jgi:hypothetical protein